MNETPEPDTDLQPALDALAARDADIARALDTCGLPPRREMPGGFAGLARAIVAQQVSAQAARAIMGRLTTALPALTPEAILDLDAEQARAVGLSRPKLGYLQGLARAVAAGDLDFDALAAESDEAVMTRLTAFKGVGRWTAESFLLFGLRRPDVFPAQDLALQHAARRLKALPARPDAAHLRDLAEAWRPWRSAAARFLWHIYRHPGLPESDG
mgnify:CR=1 FL=1